MIWASSYREYPVVKFEGSKGHIILLKKSMAFYPSNQMKRSRKLQVFVSSTFSDLKDERQAAVEAILSSGHIPAGMELFTAGNQSQMNVIKNWIDESDVYLLILGSRYGSIEPTSSKSYTHLEYEYALEKEKALFAVVIKPDAIEARVKKFGSSVMELENPKSLGEFRTLVESKIVRYWEDVKDIKISIHETLHEYSFDRALIGWIPGNEGINGAEMAEEIARLSKENLELRNRIGNEHLLLSNNLTFVETLEILSTESLDVSVFDGMWPEALASIASLFNREAPMVLDYFLWVAHGLRDESKTEYFYDFAPIKQLIFHGLIEGRISGHPKIITCNFSKLGKQLLMRLNVTKFLDNKITYSPERLHSIISKWEPTK